MRMRIGSVCAKMKLLMMTDDVANTKTSWSWLCLCKGAHQCEGVGLSGPGPCHSTAQCSWQMTSTASTVEELTLSASAFMTAGDGLPQCFAAVDGTHVAVKDLGLRALYNRKGFCSFNVQAVCNGEGRWIAVEVGNAGSMHDARAFSESSLGRGLQGVVGQFLWSARMPVQGTAMPMSILADSAYACSTFVLPAYKDNVANGCPNKARYNTLHSRARSKVERAFGRLKMRWRVLLRENDVTLPYVSTMIMACFILHNIAEAARPAVPKSQAGLAVPTLATPASDSAGPAASETAGRAAPALARLAAPGAERLA
ncbi:hypothetical protein QJQ45_029622 [Haematococcus lacustris]|nr:hypothetical protein QJQ45_029622 [Haematococcus lacustris]